MAWNRFLFAAIFEGSLYCFIDWNQWITTLEGWGTGLWNTLRTCASCPSSCRCDLSEFWTVSRSHWSAILIHTFDCDWIWFTNKLFVWSESYSSIWRNRVGSVTWNSLLLASIFEGWLDCFINRNQWITTLESWGACLWKALRTCASCTSSCRCYFRKLWTISRGDFCTILIDPFNRYWIRFSYKLLVWGEGYCTI